MKIRLLLFLSVLLFKMTQAYAETGHIYIFVSFSMPKTSIKGWMSEAEIPHASVQIRGLVNNSFKETIKRVGELTKDNRGGLQINPKLFEQFQIDQVPAVVVTSDVSCPPNISCMAPFDVIYGDVTLAYALQKIADRNDAVSSIAKNALNQLRENHAA